MSVLLWIRLEKRVKVGGLKSTCLGSLLKQNTKTSTDPETYDGINTGI